MRDFETNSGKSQGLELRNESGRSRLYLHGERFYVKGAGGFMKLDTLRSTGGNSLRTWHIDQTDTIINEARSLGLKVCAGLDLMPGRKGFDYSDPAKVRKQNDRIMSHVERHLVNDSILFWNIGNELDLHYENPVVWDAVESLAKRIRKIDSDRLLMTSVAGVDAKVLAELTFRCPSIDILGINAYKALDRVAEMIRETSWFKPYIVTEWGCDGAWEVGSTSWGAELEPDSTFKAKQRFERYKRIADDDERCLGSYAFFWGQKQEVTPTWYNIFDDKNREFQCLESMKCLWTGSAFPEKWPELKSLIVNGKTACESLCVTPNAKLEVRVELVSRGSGSLSLEWRVMEESSDKGEGGDDQLVPKEFIYDAIEEGDEGIIFMAPPFVGKYRLFVYAVCDGSRVATANFPFAVQ